MKIPWSLQAVQEDMPVSHLLVHSYSTASYFPYRLSHILGCQHVNGYYGGEDSISCSCPYVPIWEDILWNHNLAWFGEAPENHSAFLSWRTKCKQHWNWHTGKLWFHIILQLFMAHSKILPSTVSQLSRIANSQVFIRDRWVSQQLL